MGDRNQSIDGPQYANRPLTVSRASLRGTAAENLRFSMARSSTAGATVESRSRSRSSAACNCLGVDTPRVDLPPDPQREISNRRIRDNQVGKHVC